MLESPADLHTLQRLDQHRGFRIGRILAVPEIPLPSLSGIEPVSTSASLDELLADRSLDLIWLPAANHSSLTVQRVLSVLRSDKHVVIGQSPDFETREWDDLQESAGQRQRKIVCCYPGEFAPSFQLALQASLSLHLGKLEKIVCLNYAYAGEVSIPSDNPLRRINDPLPERGLFRERGIEAVRQILLLHPATVERIFARQSTLRSLSLDLEFSDGLVAHWELSLDHPAPFSCGWYLHGDRGGYVEGKFYRVEPDGELVMTPLDPLPMPPDPFLCALSDHLNSSTDRTDHLDRYRHLFLVTAASRRSLASCNWEKIVE